MFLIYFNNYIQIYLLFHFEVYIFAIQVLKILTIKGEYSILFVLTPLHQSSKIESNHLSRSFVFTGF